MIVVEQLASFALLDTRVNARTECAAACSSLEGSVQNSSVRAATGRALLFMILHQPRFPVHGARS